MSKDKHKHALPEAHKALRESEARLARELADAQRLQAISRLFLEQENPQKLYHEIVDAAVALMQSDAASLQMLDGAKDELRLLAWRGFHPESAAFWQRLATETTSTCGAALGRGERMIVPDVCDPACDVSGESLQEYCRSGLVAVQSTPLVARDGRIVGMISTHWKKRHEPADRDLARFDVLARQAADIIERNLALEALRESEARMRRAMSVPKVGVLFFDLAGHMLEANAAFQQMCGYTSEELRSAGHWDQLTAPEFHELTLQRTRDLTERGETPPYEKQMIRKDGSRWWGLFSPTRLSGSGPESQCVEFVIDVTEAKRSEEALRKSEEDLRRLNEQLEERVRERTEALVTMNMALQSEVAERRTAEDRIKKLLRELVTAQEEERRRLARELHDSLGQELAALHVAMEVMKSKANVPEMLEGVERMRVIFESLNSHVDFLAWELRPPSLDLLGLDAALRAYVQEWSQQYGIKTTYQGVGVDTVRLLPEVETNLYRIFQEALQNVYKHAGADRVNVLLERRDGHAVLIIEDNGKGYDPEVAAEERGMGVTNMSERASLINGAVEIESQPGQGTTVFVRVPVTNGFNR